MRAIVPTANMSHKVLVLSMLLLIVAADGRNAPKDALEVPSSKPVFPCKMSDAYVANMNARLEVIFDEHYTIEKCDNINTRMDVRSNMCTAECGVMTKVGNYYVIEGTVAPNDDSFYLTAMYKSVCDNLRNCHIPYPHDHV
jgi:hypothetical protein